MESPNFGINRVPIYLPSFNSSPPSPTLQSPFILAVLNHSQFPREVTKSHIHVSAYVILSFQNVLPDLTELSELHGQHEVAFSVKSSMYSYLPF